MAKKKTKSGPAWQPALFIAGAVSLLISLVAAPLVFLKLRKGKK